MRIFHGLILLFTAYCCACSAYRNTDKAGGNKEVRSFQKVFFIVPVGDIMTRVRLEKELTLAATTAGYASLMSLDVLPYSLQDPKMPAKEEFDAKAKENNCDAVMMVSVTRKDDAVIFKKGLYTKDNITILSAILAGSLSRDVSGVSNSRLAVESPNGTIPGVTNPGKYNISANKYVYQFVLYDVSTGIIMHTSESAEFEYSTMDKVMSSHCKTLIGKLQKENLLKN